ncbi:hypothetical protein V8C34DRAFT_305576 [Trichoderma compactum]
MAAFSCRFGFGLGLASSSTSLISTVITSNQPTNVANHHHSLHAEAERNTPSKATAFKQSSTIQYPLPSQQQPTNKHFFKMFVGDLVHFRAALSNGITHDMILCPSAAPTPATSAANTPDNRSLASEKNKKRFSFFSRPRPAVKAANVGAGMKLPMNIV